MGGSGDFEIGAAVSSRDGECGVLTRIVFDPLRRELTHLVVDGRHRRGSGRLVPVRLVESAGDPVALSCSLAEFEQLDFADEAQFLLRAGGALGYETDQVLTQPYYGLAVSQPFGQVGSATSPDGPTGTAPYAAAYDRVPVGEVQVRRGAHVHASDGHLGTVHGLVVDPADHHVTHLLLEEGHLFSRREVAIPIGAVAEVDEDVRLSLSRAEVAALPPVGVDAAP